MTTMPNVQTIQVSVKATAYYLAKIAAQQAGGALTDFTAGQIIVGDGNGVVPPISDLLAANGVVHEVARGSWVHGVSRNPINAAQTDILVVIPALDTSGQEIGPFYVAEYALTDETGNVCLVGTTLMVKFVTANGAYSDLAWIISDVFSNGAPILSPPTATFATLQDLILQINANQPNVTAPLTRAATMGTNGFLSVIFGIRAATEALTGYGRVATDAEFAAGTAATGVGAFAWPWASLQQIKAALAAAAARPSPPRKYNQQWISPGAYTWTVPADASDYAEIEIVGGGGGAAGNAADLSGDARGVNRASGGGASGGWARKWTQVQAGDIFTIIIPSGGTGGGTVGGTGGDAIVKKNGVELFRATGGTGGVNSLPTCTGGAPGNGVNGDDNDYGAPGSDGNPFNALVQAGPGGASRYGGGGRASTLGSNNSAVANGLAPGSGGGGIWGGGTVLQIGGIGAPGKCTIRV